MFQNCLWMALVREHASYRAVLRKDVWMSRGNRYEADVWTVGDSHARGLLGKWTPHSLQNWVTWESINLYTI